MLPRLYACVCTRAAGDLLLDRYLALLGQGDEEDRGEAYEERAREGYDGPEEGEEGRLRDRSTEDEKGEGNGPGTRAWAGPQRRGNRERERAEEQQMLWKQLEAAARQTFLVLPGWAAAIQQQFDLHRQQEQQQQRSWYEGRRGRGTERRAHAEVEAAELARWEQERQQLYGRRRREGRWGSRHGQGGKRQEEAERVRLGSSSGSFGSSRKDSDSSSSGSERGSRDGLGAAALHGLGAPGITQRAGLGVAAAGATARGPYGGESEGLRHQQQHPHQAGVTDIPLGAPGAREGRATGTGPPGGGFQARGALGEGYHGVAGGVGDALVEAVAALFSGPRPLLPSAPRVVQPPPHPRQHSDSEDDGTWGPAGAGSGGGVPRVLLLPPRKLLTRLLDVDVSEVVELVGLAEVSVNKPCSN